MELGGVSIRIFLVLLERDDEKSDLAIGDNRRFRYVSDSVSRHPYRTLRDVGLLFAFAKHRGRVKSMTTIFDKAKIVAGAVTDKTATVTGAVGTKTTEISGALATKVGELKDALLDKINSTITEINLLLPHLITLGFNLDEMNIELGIPTKLNLVLRKVSDENAAAFEGLLAEHADKPLFCAVVRLLNQTNQLAGKITFINIGFSHIEIDVGAMPSARIKFLDKGAPPV